MKTLFYLLGGLGIGAIYGIYYEYREDPIQAKFFCDTPYQYESYKRKRDFSNESQPPVDIDD